MQAWGTKASAVHPEAQRLIDELRLRPHPEGGYFVETYRSGLRVDCDAGRRHALTSIYYLLEGVSFSAFHRIKSDEIWHHYRGAPVTVEVIDVDGELRSLSIGDGHRWQAAVRPGVWFAAHLERPEGFALVGCDVAPGFDFNDFELASGAALLEEFPQHAAVIQRWTNAPTP